MRRLLFLLALASLLIGCSDRRDRFREAARITHGNPHKGRQAILRYGCQNCHTIPGIREARALVGPPLTSMGSRQYIAGELPNTPENMETWIQHPHGVEQHTVMPEMHVTPDDSRDITAYLYTLR
jgi:cytochrome c